MTGVEDVKKKKKVVQETESCLSCDELKELIKRKRKNKKLVVVIPQKSKKNFRYCILTNITEIIDECIEFRMGVQKQDGLL